MALYVSFWSEIAENATVCACNSINKYLCPYPIDSPIPSYFKFYVQYESIFVQIDIYLCLTWCVL
jgi:hypothetical protein